MKRILLWSMSTLTVLVLLFGYHTSTSSKYPVAAENAAVAPISGGSETDASAGSGGTLSAGSGSTAPTGSASSAAPGATDGAAATATGSVSPTRWGPVQVEITVAAGRITDVSVVQYPDGNGKDQQINARALPVLISETLSAQSAGIDMVSGATITSQGYVDSLQSALDRAGR
jgi:uncharacterized protein with FMN-binding domain